MIITITIVPKITPNIVAGRLSSTCFDASVVAGGSGNVSVVNTTVSGKVERLFYILNALTGFTGKKINTVRWEQRRPRLKYRFEVF